MRVRDAVLADGEAVVELIRELAEGEGESSPLDRGFVARYLESPISRILLAEEQGQVVGLLSYSIRPDLYHAGHTALIEELVVAAGRRGQGIGSALMAELLERAARQGWAEVSVSTMPDNAGAQRFYRRHGLGEEAVFLEKHLKILDF
jgi:ribosomal protein S18 acetylase RimI-like enzyme